MTNTFASGINTFLPSPKGSMGFGNSGSEYKVKPLNKIMLHHEITLNFGVPDSFALMKDNFIAV